MIRKTMRVGQARTSIKLEAEFWDYLQEMAKERGVKLPAIVSELATACAAGVSLASHLRTATLAHARGCARRLDDQLEKLSLAAGSPDLPAVLEACPLPCLTLGAGREIRHANRAFAQWLNVDPAAVLNRRLDHIMVLRGVNELWEGLADGRLAWGRFGTTYVSPGRVRAAQAVAIPLGSIDGRRGLIVMFETLASATGNQVAGRVASPAAPGVRYPELPRSLAGVLQ